MMTFISIKTLEGNVFISIQFHCVSFLFRSSYKIVNKNQISKEKKLLLIQFSYTQKTTILFIFVLC